MLDFKEFAGMFDFEERLLLNHADPDMSKAFFLNHCTFSKLATADMDCSALLDRVLKKVGELSDEEWDVLKSYLPFDVSVLDADLETAGVYD